MREGPDIAGVAALVGNPARASMLLELMGGRALTATELAHVAGITGQTASSHLGKLETAGIIAAEKQGRHRYYRLHGPDVAQLLEMLMGIAGRSTPSRLHTGPREPALRTARVCYDHLAGEHGVRVYEALRERGWLTPELQPTPAGRAFLATIGIDLSTLELERRPLCRACLDWSERRQHLAGALGAALLQRFSALGWVVRRPGTRVVTVTPAGQRAFAEHFPAPAPRPIAIAAGSR